MDSWIYIGGIEWIDIIYFSILSEDIRLMMISLSIREEDISIFSIIMIILIVGIEG
jgi:hypothetical protein